MIRARGYTKVSFCPGLFVFRFLHEGMVVGEGLRGGRILDRVAAFVAPFCGEEIACANESLVSRLYFNLLEIRRDFRLSRDIYVLYRRNARSHLRNYTFDKKRFLGGFIIVL